MNKNRLQGYLLITPLLIGCLLFYAIPFALVIQYSLSTSSGGSMSSNNVEVEIMGHDFSVTTRLAQHVAQQARDISGAEDIKISRDDDKPELQIVLDQDKLARHGLTTSEVGQAMRNRIYGNRNTKFKDPRVAYNKVVVFAQNP